MNLGSQSVLLEKVRFEKGGERGRERERRKCWCNSTWRKVREKGGTGGSEEMSERRRGERRRKGGIGGGARE